MEVYRLKNQLRDQQASFLNIERNQNMQIEKITTELKMYLKKLEGN